MEFREALALRCRWAAFALAALTLSACGPDAKFRAAQAREAAGKEYEAWTAYQEFAAAYPSDPKAPEALFRAGWLAQHVLADCAAADAFYDAVAERYAQSEPWAGYAASERSNCPDYFPLVPGARWIEGDSDTEGKNARIDLVALAAADTSAKNGAAAIIERTYYGGDKKFKTTRFLYERRDGELTESAIEGEPAVRTVIKWPLQTGTTWKTKIGGKSAACSIVSVEETVKVRAGEFNNCLKVRTEIEGVAGATVDYYAPGVGRVLNGYATPSGERRNIELLSYTPAPSSAFTAKGKK